MTERQRPEWAARLQRERESRVGSKAELARRLMAAIGADGRSVDSLTRQILDWEKGRHFPVEWGSTLAAVFEVREEELFAGHNGASSPHGPSAEEDEMRRRALLGLLAAAATAPLARETEPLRAALNQAVTSAATDRDADTWERVAYDYAHEVGAVPASALLPDLLTDFTDITTLLGASSGHVRLRMVHTAAQLAALTAIALVNLGDPRSARRWWRTAAHAADESGDCEAASLVRGRQAVFSLYEDRSPLSVLRLADDAIAIGNSAPCAGVASGHAARAQALAQLGRHEEAAVALRDLEDMFERLPAEVSDDRSSQWGWSIQRLHHVASHVHTHAGDIERAGRAQDAALAIYPARNYQGRAQVELHRAGCLLRAGDVDEGARHAVRILEGLPTEHRCDGLLRRTAVTSLALVAPSEAGRPAMRNAYEMLTLTSGER